MNTTITNIPINIGMCQDIDKNILFGIESYSTSKTPDNNIIRHKLTKSQYQRIIIYDEDEEICNTDLIYNFIPNYGGFIINNTINRILYNTIKSKTVMKNITKDTCAESVIYLNTVIKNLYNISVNDKFIIMGKNYILKTQLDNAYYDTLIIPDECENFIVTYINDLSRYNNVYFPKNIKRIRCQINDFNKNYFENKTFYFKKGTLKGVCINELFHNNISEYYRNYVNKLKYANKEIPDDFNEFIYLEDAIKSIKPLPVKVEFI